VWTHLRGQMHRVGGSFNEAALCLDNVWESVVGRSGPVRVRFFCAWESVVSWVGPGPLFLVCGKMVKKLFYSD